MLHSALLRTFLPVIFGSTLASVALGVTAPAPVGTKPKSSAPSPALAGNQLDYVVVEVNGIGRLVNNGEELLVVKGDKLVLQNAMSVDRQVPVTALNLVGYAHPQAKRAGEDRGYIVNTSVDLATQWAVDKEGTRFRVKALAKSQLAGEVYIRLIAPQLSHAVLNVNGQDSVWREGEMVRIKATDKIKVAKVITNIEGAEDNVQFQIVPVAALEELPKLKFFEIQFSREREVFARIPLQVEGS